MIAMDHSTVLIIRLAFCSHQLHCKHSLVIPSKMCVDYNGVARGVITIASLIFVNLYPIYGIKRSGSRINRRGEISPNEALGRNIWVMP